MYDIPQQQKSYSSYHYHFQSFFRIKFGWHTLNFWGVLYISNAAPNAWLFWPKKTSQPVVYRARSCGKVGSNFNQLPIFFPTKIAVLIKGLWHKGSWLLAFVFLVGDRELFWVVVSHIFLFFTTIWGRFPFWQVFFRWVETTNQSLLLTTPS